MARPRQRAGPCSTGFRPARRPEVSSGSPISASVTASPPASAWDGVPRRRRRPHLGARGMNLGIEDAFVYASLIAQGRIEDYESLRRPIVTDVTEQIERMTSLPRGQTLMAKAARLFALVFAPLAPLRASYARRFILGLDHEMNLVPHAA